MPETMSEARAALLRHLGADVRLTPGILMADAVRLARSLQQEVPGALLLDQFNNPAMSRCTGAPRPRRSGPTPAARSMPSSPRSGPAGHADGRGAVAEAAAPAVRVVAVEAGQFRGAVRRRRGQHRHPRHRRRLRPAAAGTGAWSTR